MSDSTPGEQRLRNKLAAQIVFAVLGLALTGSVTWAGWWVRQLASKVEKASEELAATRAAQAVMVEQQKAQAQLSGDLKATVGKLADAVDGIRMEQASRRGIDQQLERLESGQDDLRSRLRSAEGRLSAIEARGR